MRLKTLEGAMDFLACPKDRGNLRLDGMRSRRRNVFAGYLSCEECGAKYPIKDGVPCFYDGKEAPWRRNAPEARAALLSSIKACDGEGSLRELNGFAQMLMNREGGCIDPPFVASGVESTRGARTKAIAKLGKAVEEILSNEGLGDAQRLLLLQAFNAARYNLEIYRGTFVFGEKTLGEIIVPKGGAVVEAACATGENTMKAKKVFEKNGSGPPSLYFGFDLSEKLALEASARLGFGEGVLFAQANMMCLPLKDRAASVYMANNVWDRVSSPKAAAAEAGRALAREGAILLANCAPLQYASPDGSIVYVPEAERMGLREAAEAAGCRVVSTIRGLVWNIETLLYGSEKLPMEAVIGTKR